MTIRRSKRAPIALEEAGKRLWRSLTREFEFNSAELALLHQLCATIDEIAALKTVLTTTKPVVKGSRGQPRPNPLLAEIRAHRKSADQLVCALGLPVDGETVGRRRSAQAKQAADARWAKTRTKTGSRIQRLGLVNTTEVSSDGS
ncbi:P27 family phage terminase small subunit [Mycobacterium aquaticum]|uniref:Terminase n=1 Tax=Mycobacterium aquaticum TaxID=1927124 RepID=A0A1X0ANS6_9MYCO|nr:hypothetical protein [Mycobacterium aquaticum]ORA31565.1 hypothetical protein BST13_24725 [Mycobacterium aquaticum]